MAAKSESKPIFPKKVFSKSFMQVFFVKKFHGTGHHNVASWATLYAITNMFIAIHEKVCTQSSLTLSEVLQKAAKWHN